MNALGTQILLELKQCNRDILDDMSYIREVMLGAAEEVGATVLGETFHKFSPQGVTGLVSIAESHLCIHTWPEYGYAAVDVFTCGEGFDPRKAAEFLIRSLQCQDPSISEVKRGLLGEMIASQTS